MSIAPSRQATQVEGVIPTATGDIRSHFLPHDRMRLAIAGNMQRSVTEAPHVTAVFEADFSAIVAHREAHKAAFAKKGVKLTYTAYLVAAAAEAMKVAPAINSRWHADRLELFDDINIGVGTALGSKGLIVPVLRKVQQLSLKGIAAGLDELIEKARAEKLTAADIKGGTFTISNHGVSGSLFAAPIIINQPQSAILGVGKLEKRVVVREIGGRRRDPDPPDGLCQPHHRSSRRRRPPDQCLAEPLRRDIGELAARLSGFPHAALSVSANDRGDACAAKFGGGDRR